MKNVTVTLRTDLREEFARTVRRLSRRKFFTQNFKAGLGALLATMTNVPFGVQRALAEGSIGLNGKKLLFIFLRGGNDGLNTLIPIEDPAYAANRPNLTIPKDPAVDYTAVTGGMDFPQAGSVDGTYDHYPYAIRAGNGFAAIHPSLKWIAPLYNAGHLALIHRVAYPDQSRSHTDSQRIWETGIPGSTVLNDGLFHRVVKQSGLAGSTPFTGVSFQAALPLSLRGSDVVLPNFSDARRFDLLGVPNTSDGRLKFIPGLAGGLHLPATPKDHRPFMDQQYEKMLAALGAFSQFDFSEGGNTYRDFRVDAGHVGEAEVTDGDQEWADAWASTDGGGGYYLFPTTNNKNGGAQRLPGATPPQTGKYVVDTGAYNAANTALFNSLKAAAITLNQTDAFIAGTEYPANFDQTAQTGFDTGADQGVLTGEHSNMLRRLSWAFYSLWKYFSIYGKGGPKELPGAKTSWDDIVIVTLSEFGRTSREDATIGTDHAEASVMLVGGGGIKGFGKPANTNGSNGGIFCCNTTGCDGPAYNNHAVNWITGSTGTMFPAGASSPGYLLRAVDFRSVLGRVIRNHLGATQNQLNTILPGYASESTEHLLTGGVCTDGITIAGEPDFI